MIGISLERSKQHRLNPQVDVIPQIQICRGAPNALQPIAVIALNVDAKANGSYAYDIPSDYQYGDDCKHSSPLLPQGCSPLLILSQLHRRIHPRFATKCSNHISFHYQCKNPYLNIYSMSEFQIKFMQNAKCKMLTRSKFI